MRDEKGQALFEFIFFLPLIVVIYSIVVSLGSAINGSINQQKATRGYFYARMKNNSTMPKPKDSEGSWQKFGMVWIGWREKFKSSSDTPLAPCYNLKIPFASGGGQTCSEWNSTKPSFIRVQTVYGLCGATYQRQNDFVVRSPYNADIASCLIE